LFFSPEARDKGCGCGTVEIKSREAATKSRVARARALRLCRARRAGAGARHVGYDHAGIRIRGAMLDEARRSNWTPHGQAVLRVRARLDRWFNDD
jgi:hypothetical protein